MIYFMRGVSCSGKSTLTQATIQAGDIRLTDVISSDVLRGLLTGDIANQSISGEVFDLMRSILRKRIKYKAENTVIDATNLRMRDVKGFIDICSETGEMYSLIEIQPPPLETLLDRNNRRWQKGGMKIPEDVFHRQISRFFGEREKFVNLFKECDDFIFYKEIPQYLVQSSFI